MSEIPFLGEAASIACALCWAVAVTLFRPAIERHGAWAVNALRSALGAALLGVTVLLLGEAGSLAGAPLASLGVVALSGVAGLTLGDTALFAAVGRLGAHRTLVFQTLGPVFTALVALGLYGERLVAGQVAGSLVILAGIALVVTPPRRAADAAPPAVSGGALAAGYALAALAAFGQGSGLALAKGGMDDLSLVGASFVRLLAGAVTLVPVMAWNGHLRGALRIARRASTLRQVMAPTLLGTYVAFILMMAGLAFAPATVAAVLISTSPIFSLFVDRVTLGTPITVRGLAGTLLAVVGVAALTVLGG